MRKNILVLIAFVTFALAGVALAVATTATATQPNNAGAHVTICHATGSESNPFVKISPDAEGVISGHVGIDHQDGRDIIPPFDYHNAIGVLVHFAGQNWDEEHQAIYFNDCNSVSTTTTTDTQPPPTQTVTVTTPGETVATPGPSTTVTVTTPGTTNTVTTPGKTVTKVKVVKKTVVKKVHVNLVSHRTPKTTG